MPKNNFSGYEVGLESPAPFVKSITPNDSADLPTPYRSLHCAGAAGTVRVVTVGGDTDTLYIQLGAVLPVQVRRVLATGTTATGLKGFN